MITSNDVISEIQGDLKAVKKMEESQNYVIKDCHDKMNQMKVSMAKLERTDFEEKFNNITRRMISDVVREHLTPIQMQFNVDIKSLKRSIDEHSVDM